jgi:HK97 family phage prohead protease
MSEQSDRMHGLIDRTTARYLATLGNPVDLKHAEYALAAVRPLPWYSIRAASNADTGEDAPPPADPEVATIYIFDEIGGSMGVSASALVKQIDAITEPTIHVRINSPGGSVRDAIAIYNALNHHPARIVSYVDALAASAATVIAFAGDEIVVMPGGQMMFHDASMPGDGNEADYLRMATFLGRQSQNVADIYALRTATRSPALTADDWRAMMLEETWMYGQEAVELGAADRYDTSSAPSAPVITEPDLAERMARSHDLSKFRYRGRRNPPRRPGADGARPRSARVVERSREVERAWDEIRAGRVAPSPADLAGAAAARGEAVERRAHALAQEGRSVPVLRTSERFRSQLLVARAEMPADVGAARLQGFASKLQRAATVSRGGKELEHIAGYASMYGRKHRYEMWDAYGPYWEFVHERAGAKSLASQPDVAFLINHMGVALARTRAGTLELADDDTGLADDAYVNPDRRDVQDFLIAIDDGAVTEQSFAFMVDDGRWSEDFTEFGIVRYNIDRGDVSGVTFGANPFTSISARGQQIMADIDRMPVGLAEAALRRLSQRTDVASRLLRAAEPDQPTEAERAPGTMCPQCGAVVPAGAATCPNCGHQMNASQPSSLVTRSDEAEPVATGRRITHIEALLADDL